MVIRVLHMFDSLKKKLKEGMAKLTRKAEEERPKERVVKPIKKPEAKRAEKPKPSKPKIIKPPKPVRKETPIEKPVKEKPEPVLKESRV